MSIKTKKIKLNYVKPLREKIVVNLYKKKTVEFEEMLIAAETV